MLSNPTQIHKALYKIVILVGILLFFCFGVSGSVANAQEAGTEILTGTPASTDTKVETPESIEQAANSCTSITNGTCTQTQTGLSLCRLNNICFVKVDLNENSLRPRVVIAPNGGTSWLSSMASSVGAYAAINGDYFSGCPDTTSPLNCGEGLTYLDGTDYTDYTGSEWQNRRSLGFNDNFDPNIGWPGEMGGNHRQLLAGGPQVTFGGEYRWRCWYQSSNTEGNCACQNNTVVINDELFGCSANNWWNRPQTFIAFSDDRNTLYLAVSEPGYNKTPHEMHDVLWVNGARYTLKMDGGGSSGMYFNSGGYSFAWDGGRAIANSWAIVPNSPPPPTCYMLLHTHSGSGSDPTASPSNSSGCSSGQYKSGESITMTSYPASGWHLGSWGGTDNSSSSHLTMPSNNHTVTANYIQDPIPTYNLSVSKAGTGSGAVMSNPGGINCGSDCSEIYLNNTQVTLTATPTNGHTFAGWSGACSGTGSCTVTMTSAKSVTATFNAPNNPILTVIKSGSGSGTVTSNPGGINCGTDCSQEYANNTQVTLTATPTSGHTFAGWSGECSGTGSCTVTMTSEKSVTATFNAPNNPILTVGKNGSGSGTVTSNPGGINCGTDCSESYTLGTVVTLTATSSSESTFSGWSGGGCSGTGTCTVTMNSAQSVTATFTTTIPTGWSIVSSTPNLTLWDVDILSENSARIAGGWCCNPWISTIRSWNGLQWQDVAHSGQYQQFTMDMVSDNEGWYGGQFGELLHYINGSFQHVNVTTHDIVEIDMVSSQEGWAITNDGYPNYTSEILHFVNGTWQVYSNLNSAGLDALDMVSAADGWIGGIGTFYHYQNGNWVSVQSPTADAITTIDMFSASDGWAGTHSGEMLHYSNGNWSMHSYPGAGWGINGIDMLSGDEGWAVSGYDLIFHYLNGQWNSVDNPATNVYLMDIDMISPSEGWAVGGFDGVVLRYYMPLHVRSIKRVNPNPTSAATVDFSVTFSTAVTGVDANDFTLSTTGVFGANISGVSGTGANYTVTVNTGTGNGTIRLNVIDNDTIVDAASNLLGGAGAGNGNFTTGEVYTVNKGLVLALDSTSAQDGWILESAENDNTGGTINSTATTLRLGDNAARKQYRSILSFNTGPILPDTAVITKVTLKVKRQGVIGGGNPITMFQGFMVDMRKGTFGTSALQVADWQANANKIYGPFSPALTGEWYTFNLTSAKAYINKFATGSGLTQIRLRFKLDDNNNAIANYLSLYSGNAGAASRPQLIVEYYVP